MKLELIQTFWTLVWHFGITGLGVLGALVFAWYSPVYKKTALWVAAAITIGMLCYATGVANEQAFMQAKIDAANRDAMKKAREASKGATDEVNRQFSTVPDTRGVPRAKRLRGDRYDRDNQSKPKGNVR